MARPKLNIPADQVRKLAKLGCTNREIAGFFDCDEDTIHNRFSEEIAKGKSDLAMRLRRKQIATAMAGNAVMLIWLGKQYLGQKDKVEHTGDEGSPIEHKVTVTIHHAPSD